MTDGKRVSHLAFKTGCTLLPQRHEEEISRDAGDVDEGLWWGSRWREREALVAGVGAEARSTGAEGSLAGGVGSRSLAVGVRLALLPQRRETLVCARDVAGWTATLAVDARNDVLAVGVAGSEDTLALLQTEAVQLGG